MMNRTTLSIKGAQKPLLDADQIRQAVDGRAITLEAAIAAAKKAGCIPLAVKFEGELANLNKRLKSNLLGRVKSGELTVPEAMKIAELAGYADDFCIQQIRNAANRHHLTDQEMVRRLAAVADCRSAA